MAASGQNIQQVLHFVHLLLSATGRMLRQEPVLFFVLEPGSVITAPTLNLSCSFLGIFMLEMLAKTSHFSARMSISEHPKNPFVKESV